MRPRVPLVEPVLSTSRCFDEGRSWRKRATICAAFEEHAQATVEAAFLLPSFFIVLLLMLQPVCLLYTRAIMEGAASSAARLMMTAEGQTDEACRAFALRQLAAIPNVTIFHEGGPLSWDIECSEGGEEGAVRVGIEGSVRPLPVLGAFVGAFGEQDGHGGVLLTVEVAYEGRPDWLEGDYASWVSIWD